MPQQRTPSYRGKTVPWTWQDDCFVLFSLIGIAVFGILLVGERRSVEVEPTVIASEIAEPPAATEPLRETQRPYAVAAALDPVASLPPSRALNPGEQISDAPSFIDVFGSELNTRLWVEHESNRDDWFMANDYRKNRILTDADGLELQIDRHDDQGDRPHAWVSGEINSRTNYGYGRYEVFMTPAQGSGLISAFFTYTGPWFGDPHDEIDIEFLGKYRRKVEFNAFRSGQPFGSKTLRLPFDATKSANLYAFEWHPDAITWFIDGIAVHRLDAKDHRLPRSPQKIYANVWTGNMPQWHGRARFEPGVTARFECISFQKFGDTTRQCSDLFEAQIPFTPSAVAATD